MHAAGNMFNVKLEIPKTFDSEQATGEKAEFRKNLSLDRIRNAINAGLPHDVRLLAAKFVSRSFRSQCSASGRVYHYILPISSLRKDLQEPSAQELDQILGRLNQLGAQFVGTRSYHNFSKGFKANEPTCKRVVFSCVVSKLNPKFILFRIEGQSFIYHQIRKMIGSMIQLLHCGFSDDFLKMLFTSEAYGMTWLAPADGLYLREIHYKYYNEKENIQYKMELNETERASVKEFELQVIHPVIFEAELKNEA